MLAASNPLPRTVLTMAGTSLLFAATLWAVGYDDDQDFSDSLKGSATVAGLALVLFLMREARE